MARYVLHVCIMPGIFIHPEWWDWAMFIIVPILLIILVVAVWSIGSGLAGIILGDGRASSVDKRTVPDIMAFLKQRRSRKTRFPFESTRRHIIGR